MNQQISPRQIHRQFFYAQITLSLLTILAPTISYGLFARQARQAPKALRTARPALTTPNIRQALWRIGIQQRMFSSQQPTPTSRSTLLNACKVSICIGGAAALAYYEYNKKMEQLTKKIFRATKTGDINQVRRLLPFFDVNQPDEYGDNLLHVAILRDNLEMVKLLVNYGADVNASNEYHGTPIQLAIKYCRLNIVKYLYLDAKATVETSNKNGALLKQAFLSSRFEQDIKELVKFLVEVCKIDINSKDDEGTTILHTAVWRDNSPALLEFLVHQLNANVDAQDNLGNTPLHTFFYEWNLSYTQERKLRTLIVECGADIEVKNNNGLTPLAEIRQRLERKPDKIEYVEDLFGKLIKERREYVKQPHETESHEQVRVKPDRPESESYYTSTLGGLPL